MGSIIPINKKADKIAKMGSEILHWTRTYFWNLKQDYKTETIVDAVAFAILEGN